MLEKAKKFLVSKDTLKVAGIFTLLLVLDLVGVDVATMGMLLVGGGIIDQASIREHEDLSDEIDVLFENERDMNLLSFVRYLPATVRATHEKHEWQDDTMPPESLSLTASEESADWDTTDDITDLPVATAQITKLKVGDVLMLDSGEVVVVKSIDTSAETIDLVKRGWGGTTAAAQGTSAFTAYIIGNAQVDGSDPMDENYKAPTEVYNYVQIFEDTAGVSGKVMRSRITKNTEMARQLTIKLKRLMSQLNYAMLYGVREKSGDRATMQGMRDRTSLTYNVNGALTLAKVYSIVAAMIDAGGSPSAFHGSPTTIGDLEQLLSSYVESSTSDWNAKLTVKKVNLLGIDIEIHVDKHISDSELLLVDYNRVRYGTQESEEATGGFKAYEVEKNGKQWKKHIVGYYTMEQRQAAASVCRAYGIT
jgi:hypothetical protein